jgi:GTP diphosphokinase / guanosine-3',5'-bis(diphosphate) 3'-diphosphatase
METRESFFARIEPLFAPSVLRDIQVAYTLAKFGHRAQTRKETDAEGNPLRYFEHVRRVAIILIDEVKIVNREMVLAALLHDGIEDTRDLTAEMIEHCFGIDTVNIVKVLSKVPKEGYLDRFHACTDWRAYIIKGCDRLDNLRSLEQSDKAFQLKQVTETKDKFYPIFDKMLDIIPSEYRSKAFMLRDNIRAETERRIVLAR